VDIVKIGFFGKSGHAECARSLARITRNVKIVAVMFADQKPDFRLLPLLADSGFYGAMLDTADKTAGGLRSWMSDADLQGFVSAAHSYGLVTGLAGSLRGADIPFLASLRAGYLGFRGALCTDDERKSTFDTVRVTIICKTVAQTQQSCTLKT
jgi:dihydroneopterin aldolase